MKTKIFTLLAAMLLLFATGAMAQSNEIIDTRVTSAVKGDVNGDGVVSELDIAAIIAIMQNAGGVAEPTKYYWYVGQTNPATMANIEPIVDKNSNKEGWRLIGTSLPTYSSLNKLTTGFILTGLSDMNHMYLAIPTTPTVTDICPRDGAGNDGTKVNMYTRLTDKVINGVTYKIYKSVDDLLDAFGDDIY